jgi:2'-5' RNA ligase
MPERLFVSLELPAPCRNALAALYEPDLGADWTRPEQLHLTMRFLGDVDEAMIEAIEAKLSEIRVAPFLLPLEGVGVFPPRGLPKILWAGIGKADTRLFQLRQKIDDALLAAGWRGLMRSFDPHITLARIKAEAAPIAIESWLHNYKDFEGPPFRVDQFHLVRSELSRAGATHTVRRSFTLSK